MAAKGASYLSHHDASPHLLATLRILLEPLLGSKNQYPPRWSKKPGLKF
jgi:hypothetical protein